MAKTLTVEDDEFQWLIEGLESLQECNKSALKTMTLPSEKKDRKQVLSQMDELDALMTKIRSA